MNKEQIKNQITESYNKQLFLRKNGQGINYEGQIRKIYETVLQDGCVAVDVGANQGGHTVSMCRKVAPSGKVLAFEGNPDMSVTLENNLKKNNLDRYCEIYSMAVSFYDGETEFVLALDSLGYSGIKERVYDIPDMLTRKIKVACCKLDTALSNLDRCDFIKIDVEGGEYHVLQGSCNLVEKFRPVITFECGVKSYGVYGVKPDDLADFFLDKNYIIYDVIGNQLTDKELFVYSDKTPGLWDYLAIPKEHKLTNQIVDSIKV